ncbi:MAG: NAD(P)/FAD-dependent oxidoreductase [Pseudomonadales bacterium]|nr:NAD(P)/FAD-dependent oxidoreductase [Pseudomonadales bacterium]MCP5171189.1 NAD(P)/FAD-dependent oxidoreductase [Pseudomonadales bacterium]MCP5301573.1 NAD(P)/FAD-dependent oxidoreductase [Pseudomonadales bacterium]
MTENHCVIIGGSHAAAQLAPSLRQGGWNGKITIISADPFPPYHRPPLSKAYLDGSSTLEQLQIRPPQFYEKNNIDLLLGSSVTEIDRKNRQVILHDGGKIPYTKLALTTGAKVRKIDIPGSNLDGVHYLRDMGDVSQIKHFVGTGKSAVIIGGGYIGLETAASLRKMGMEVTVLEAMPRVLQRVTTEEISAFYTRVHTEEGVRIITEAAVQSINGEHHAESVSLGSGEDLKADLVIIGVGVIPETELAEAAGLEINNGIVVNEFAQTSDPDIVSAGDCTFHYNPIYDRHLRLESVQNATDQAKVAANTLCGKLEPYRALPWFWSDQFDLKLQIAGLSQGYDQVVIRGDTSTGRSFAAFYLLDGKLLAVDAINRPQEFMLCRRQLTEIKTVDPARLADESISIKEVFNN